MDHSNAFQAALQKFVSLGDNCELGMVQRHFGHEESGLLRWAGTPPDSLIKGLTTRFSELYAFENIVPIFDGIITDAGTGISFHSDIRSEVIEGKREFIKKGEALKISYLEEFEKICYQKEKLLTQLQSGEKIFVYKHNGNRMQADQLEALRKAILTFNARNLLLVLKEAADPLKIGVVETVAERLILGHIDYFAHYDAVDRASFQVWKKYS